MVNKNEYVYVAIWNDGSDGVDVYETLQEAIGDVIVQLGRKSVIINYDKENGDVLVKPVNSEGTYSITIKIMRSIWKS